MTASANAMPFASREVTLTRTANAPRERVYKAWTDPQQVAQWWGPSGFTCPVCEMDVRPGGVLRIVMRGPDGAEYPMTGTFREVVAPERLVFSVVAVDPAGDPLLEQLTSITLAEHGGQTAITVRTSAVGLVAHAAPALEGMEQGWRENVERMAVFAEQG